MSAYFIATVTVKDGEKFQEYAQKSKETFASFDAEIITRGMFQKALAGSEEHTASAVVKFASMEKLEAWHASDEYQALIPLREEAANISITAYQVPEA